MKGVDYGSLRRRVLTRICHEYRSVYGQPADQEDAAHDALLAMLAAKDEVQCPIAYALGAARLGALRASSRRPHPPSIDDSVAMVPTDEADPVDHAIARDEWRMVRRTIRTLLRGHRDTLYVLLEEGYSAEFVARKFRIRRDHARMRISRAVAALRTRLRSKVHAEPGKRNRRRPEREPS